MAVIKDLEDEQYPNDKERLEKLELYLREIDTFILSLPLRQQRIIDMRVKKQMKWQDVAAKMGYGATESGIKKIYYRIFNNVPNVPKIPL